MVNVSELAAGVGLVTASLWVEPPTRYVARCLTIGALVGVVEALWLILLAWGASSL